ncbi:hypothetical protein POM88_021568 [Heracleum sosnowskyi]|uniref:Uncharacterized protein n=1 Tax=Heracleum sosnowskyi TaxID=360622 RepID=A0AAD8IG45_9APIA|nr:hypothetical protein POM88_021568 [Heracleum sosnowskyi]
MVPSMEYIIAVLSVMRCEKAFMPIDPSWTDEKVSMVVSSSKADFVIGPAYLAGGRRCHQLDKAHSGKSTSSNRKESDCLKEGSNKRQKQKVQFAQVNVPRTSKQFWTHENNVIPMQNIGLKNCNAWNSEVVTQLRNSEVVWRIVMLGILV